MQQTAHCLVTSEVCLDFPDKVSSTMEKYLSSPSRQRSGPCFLKRCSAYLLHQPSFAQSRPKLPASPLRWLGCPRTPSHPTVHRKRLGDWTSHSHCRLKCTGTRWGSAMTSAAGSCKQCMTRLLPRLVLRSPATVPRSLCNDKSSEQGGSPTLLHFYTLFEDSIPFP